MKQHLSSEQIDKVMAEMASPEERVHASECRQCAAELEHTRRILLRFSDAVRHRAGQQVVTTSGASQQWHRGRAGLRLHWSAGMALILAMTAVPLLKFSVERRRELQAREDSRLLEQVNQHVSRVVPAPMEPFAELLSIEDETETGGHQ